MPKLKTHKGAAKRFKKTGTGKIVRHKAGLRHILSSKAKKRKKQLGHATLVSDGDYKKSSTNDPVRMIQ
jgi:large subunit ribosomal protein L35